jgi:hypothetical protein
MIFFIKNLNENVIINLFIYFTCRKRRQPSKNATKAALRELSTPQRPTREEILRDSPGRVTGR